MAELTWPQYVSLWIGVIGGALGAINTIQSWRRNRPIVSVNPDRPLADESIEIEVTNPAARPITITHSRCFPGPHSLKPADYEWQIDGAREHDLNLVIEPKKSEKLTFIPPDGAFLLWIYWHSNAAIIFSFVPLCVIRTKGQAERLKRTRRR